MILNKENEIMDRQNLLYEHLSAMQTLCIFILVLGFIEYKHVGSYPLNSLYFFTLLSLAGMGVVLCYNSAFFQNINIRDGRVKDIPKLNLVIKLIYIAFPLAIAATLFNFGEGNTLVHSIFILPVLFTATVMGKKASYLMSTVCTLVLIFAQADIKLNLLVPALESNIFLICTMYMSGWFIGGLVEIEAQHRMQLKLNMLSLKEEMARRKQMEKEMGRLDRLNLIGEMAAGLGHEIRNPMTTIRGFLQIIAEKEKYVQEREFFDLMISELDRANSIITEFLSLAKNKAVDLKEHSLNVIIESLYPLLQAEAMITEKNIEKQLGEIPFLLLDEKEIRQLILNLVRNGLEAMPTGGKLIIRTLMDGGEAVLAVQDEGAGIEDEVLGKIGTPFFTTKDSGTGLGLAVCHSIAARHKAVINLETTPRGTTFYIRFRPNIAAGGSV
jgi:signal transduction histidine kinase